MTNQEDRLSEVFEEVVVVDCVFLGSTVDRGMGASNKERGFVMRKSFSTWLIVASVGLAAMLVQGCKKQAAAPARPVVRSTPPVNTVPDFAFAADPWPIEDVDAGAATHHSGRRLTPVQPPVPVQPMDTQPAVAAAQRRQDAVLLQQQQAASQGQQQELDREVQQNLQMEQQVQAEPRIQEAPEEPLSPPMPALMPGQEAPRIQDVPEAPQMTPVLPTQPQ
jgi:hypothetical protein